MAVTDEYPGLFEFLWDRVSGFFRVGFQNVWAGFLDLVEPATERFMKVFRLGFPEFSDETLDAIIDSLAVSISLDPTAASNLKSHIRAMPWGRSATVLFTWVTMMLMHQKLFFDAVSGDMKQKLNTMYSPESPYPTNILRAAFVAPEKTGEVRHAMKRSGLSDEDIDLHFLANYALYDPTTVAVLWLRKVLSDDEAFNRLRELGYTDTRIKELMQTWSIIPGVQDLLTMVAKEAFEPEFVQKYGLGDEFPEEQAEWMEKQGLSRYWQEKYWAAHWEPPSIQMGYEMLQRGVITRDELNDLFKAVEVPPYWREKLMEISFRPFTRVDVRRMHDMKVLNDEELIRAYMDGGYNRERAVKLAEFTKRYNAKSDKDLTKGEILEGYREKVMTHEDAMAFLIEMEYDQNEAEYILAMEDLFVQKGYEKAIIKNIGDRYQLNLIDASEARKRLADLALPGIKIETLMDTWGIDKFEDRKLPSKNDLDKMLTTKIINDDQYRNEMQKLGYGQVYIDWYEALAKQKKK